MVLRTITARGGPPKGCFGEASLPLLDVIHSILLAPKAILFGFALSISAAPSFADERPALPNIVLMMADDMGVGDTSAYLGKRLSPSLDPIGRTLQTPNLEAFAKEGMIFTEALAPASMCSSTRYSLLTGRCAHRAPLKHQGWLPHGPNRPMIAREMTTLPEMLQRAGYHTGGIGKYHVGMDYDNGSGEPATDFFFHDADLSKPLLDGPCDHGFDEYFGVPGNTEDPLDTEPRFYIRNKGLEIGDPLLVKRIGMGKREGKILAAPDWDLRDLAIRFLTEADAFLDRRATEKAPFFLYVVPNANHNQRNPSGTFAVPEELDGVPIKGESRYSDGKPAGDREDMVLENDVLFGKILEKLRATDDPRWPGHKMIENTLVIFTSDNGPNIGNEFNDQPNQESGGLRGKKAKIWEGGLRVPFLASWPGVLKGAKTYDELFSLTDLFATLASVAGEELQPNEAGDSHDCLAHWVGKAEAADERPRLFFCHLGPPVANDALALRAGDWKLIAEGGLVDPHQAGLSRGAVDVFAHIDLMSDPLETGVGSTVPETAVLESQKELLLSLHNRGAIRDGAAVAMDGESGDLILDDGWHNPRNDVEGEIGFEFRVDKAREVTHLGMWDAPMEKTLPSRAARAVPGEGVSPERPDPKNSKRRTLESDHRVLLRDLKTDELVGEIAIGPGALGELVGEFRYLKLSEPVKLEEGRSYRLTMTTSVGDGDPFRDPSAWDGLSPVLSTVDIQIERAVFLRSGEKKPTLLPGPIDLSVDHFRYRLPVGPTLRLGL